MRIYLPATVDELDASEGLLVAPRRAHAVTTALSALLPDEDEEGWEFAAQLMAADDALVLLAGRPSAPTLRLVLTVEVPDAEVEVPARPAPDEPASLVTLLAPVALADLVCAHVDEPAVRDLVRQALDGSDEALDALAEQDLLWYDVSELARIPH